MAKEPRRVLVVAPAWVGDMVMSQTIYSHLKAADPDVVIDILAPQSTVALASRMPEVSRSIVIDQAHGQLGIRYRYQLGRRLVTTRYDQAILTPNSLKSALVPFFAGIPVRTGFPGECRHFLLNDIRPLDKNRLPKMADRFLALAIDREQTEASGAPAFPRLRVDPDNQQSLITRLGLDIKRPIVGICPGAEFGNSKQWPEEHYAALAREVFATGGSVWIFGSRADVACGARISQQAPEHCINLAGQTSLPDAVDLLALCSQVVTNDSGLMHMAAAVGCRVIAIYGSTSPLFTPPLSHDASIVQRELSCRPCFARECPLGHKNCLVQISAQDVVRLL